MHTLFCSSIAHDTPTAAAAVLVSYTTAPQTHLRAPHTPVQLLHRQKRSLRTNPHSPGPQPGALTTASGRDDAVDASSGAARIILVHVLLLF